MHLYKEVLQLREKVLGKEHLNTLSTIDNLAGLYVRQGRYVKAEPLLKKVLQLREKILGKEHAVTLVPSTILPHITINEDFFKKHSLFLENRIN